MNTLLDHSLVGVALIASAAYALWSFGPRSFARRLQRLGAALLACLPAFLGMRGLAHRLADRAVKGGANCGGCDHCGTDTGAAPSSSTEEVRVALTKIGRRS